MAAPERRESGPEIRCRDFARTGGGVKWIRVLSPLLVPYQGDRSMGRASRFAAFLLGLCLPRLALADDPVSIPSARPQQVRQTVERAIGYLQAESAAWLNTRKCAACHHVPMPLWALSEAERQGYVIDKKF